MLMDSSIHDMRLHFCFYPFNRRLVRGAVMSACSVVARPKGSRDCRRQPLPMETATGQ